jgi:CRP-like cAMP-binding protein
VPLATAGFGLFSFSAVSLILLMSTSVLTPGLACSNLQPLIFGSRTEGPFERGEGTYYASGSPIPLPSDQLWLVKSGLVLLSTSYDTGEEALLGLLTTGSLFGLPLSCVSPYQARGLTDVWLHPLAIAELEQSPQLMGQLWIGLAQRQRQSEALLALQGHRLLEDRLRQFLHLLAQEFGQDTPQGIRLRIRLTHQHIANALGSSRVTITRLMGRLQRQGWLEWGQGRHLILCREKIGLGSLSSEHRPSPQCPRGDG